MSDDLNKAVETAAEAEARKRAERIAAIRKSVRSASDNVPSYEEEAARKALSKAEDALSGDAHPAVNTSEWEDEIAARIAKHVQRVRQNRNSGAESILRELDEQSAAGSIPVSEQPSQKSAPLPQKPLKYRSHAAEPIQEEAPAASPEKVNPAAPEEIRAEEKAPAQESTSPDKKKKKKKKKKKRKKKENKTKKLMNSTWKKKKKIQ